MCYFLCRYEYNKKIIKRAKERIQTNISIPHPTLVTLGIGIGVGLIAVLVLNMVVGMEGIQQAEAMQKVCRPNVVCIR
jgi:hypothetical protein